MFLRHTTEDKNVRQVANLSYDYYFRRGLYVGFHTNEDENRSKRAN